MSAPAAATAPGAAPPRRRRRPRARTIAAIAVGVVLLLALALVAYVGWFFSGVALAVDTDPVDPVQVTVSGDTVTLPREDSTTEAGLHALRFADGRWGVISDEVGGDATTVVRSWRPVEGEIPDGSAPATVDSDAFVGTPDSVDLEYSDVTVTSDIGDLPAWLVPADPASATGPGTWVVFAHGRGGSREEALRYLPLWHDLGYSVLVPTYRNDEGAPPAENGYYGFGETEWRDIDAAVGLALDSGADRIVLAGWSMGGAIALQVLDRSEHADAIAALVLDAPVVDWNAEFLYQGSLYGLPHWLSAVAIRFIEVRGGLDLDDYDWVSRAADLPGDVPIYIVHSNGDQFVPNGPTKDLAAARPDVVTLVTPDVADHTREWNVDPDGYEADMREWLTTTLGS